MHKRFFPSPEKKIVIISKKVHFPLKRIALLLVEAKSQNIYTKFQINQIAHMLFSNKSVSRSLSEFFM